MSAVLADTISKAFGLAREQSINRSSFGTPSFGVFPAGNLIAFSGPAGCAMKWLVNPPIRNTYFITDILEIRLAALPVCLQPATLPEPSTRQYPCKKTERILKKRLLRCFSAQLNCRLTTREQKKVPIRGSDAHRVGDNRQRIRHGSILPASCCA